MVRKNKFNGKVERKDKIRHFPSLAIINILSGNYVKIKDNIVIPKWGFYMKKLGSFINKNKLCHKRKYKNK